MMVKGDGSCLYRNIASHIISFCLNDIWTERITPGKKAGIKQATFEVVNDLKALISQKDNEMLTNICKIHAKREVNDFIKEKIEE